MRRSRSGAARAARVVEAGEGVVVAAAYRHRMSRALDPQLHTHVVCANVARGPDGRWTALDARHLYEHAQTAGFLYQAHLRAEVRDRLGLEWGPVVKGAAELVDMPAEVLGRVLAPAGRRSWRPRARPASRSWRQRARQVPGDRHARAQAVRRRDAHVARGDPRPRGSSTGSTPRRSTRCSSVAAGAAAPATPAAATGAGERAVGDELAGPGGLTEKANTFGERDVLREYAAAAAQGARVGEVRDQGARFAGRGDVLTTTAGELTTEDLVAAERRLIAAAVGRAGEGSAVVVAGGALERALAGADRPLTEEQAGAVRAVATSGNGVDVIEALAGTGKTFIAGTLRRVYEDAGYRVIGVAPTGRAVRELAEEAGVALPTPWSNGRSPR